jgi:hypothetical protein
VDLFCSLFIEVALLQDMESSIQVKFCHSLIQLNGYSTHHFMISFLLSYIHEVLWDVTLTEAIRVHCFTQYRQHG